MIQEKRTFDNQIVRMLIVGVEGWDYLEITEFGVNHDGMEGMVLVGDYEGHLWLAEIMRAEGPKVVFANRKQIR